MKLNTEEVIKVLIELLLEYLEELKSFSNKKEKQFQYGEKTAFIESLEYLQSWEFVDKYGLNFDIKEIYSI